MSDINDLIDFVKFTHEIRNVRRALILDGTTQENDAEHSYQLAFIAWFIIDRDELKLDKYRAVCLAMVHDIVEVYAGDVIAFAPVKTLADQRQKEAIAVRKLREQWPAFNSLHKSVYEYENLSSEEAKFVFALDKLVPIINNYLYEGKAWKKHGITLEKMQSIKVGKIDKNPRVDEYYQQLLKILEKNPRIFGTE